MLFLPILLSLSAGSEVGFYVGTYTSSEGSKGIYHAKLNLETGRISEPRLVAETDNPSFVTLHPKGRFLYSVRERGEGEVNAFAIEADGKLRFLNKLSTAGADPCHLAHSASGDRLLVANYTGGNVSDYSIAADGSLKKKEATFQAEGSGPDKGRQEKPHLHAVGFTPDAAHVVACDLGTDSVYVFDGKSPALGSPISAGKVRPGGGPRHFALSKDGKFLYANEEMLNAVTVFARDPKTGSLSAIQSISSLPPDFKDWSSTAELLIHPNGKLLFVSNRGHNSVTSYRIGSDGKLELIQIAPTVRIPRGMDLDPTGKWLVVGSQDDNTLVSMSVDPATGKIGAPGPTVSVGRPVCVVFERR